MNINVRQIIRSYKFSDVRGRRGDKSKVGGWALPGEGTIALGTTSLRWKWSLKHTQLGLRGTGKQTWAREEGHQALARFQRQDAADRGWPETCGGRVGREFYRMCLKINASQLPVSRMPRLGYVTAAYHKKHSDSC